MESNSCAEQNHYNRILKTDSLRVMPTDAPDGTAVTCRYVLLNTAAQMTGYTVKAMQRKIERCDWIEGKVWVRAPDGRILIDLWGFQKWVEGR